MVSRWQGICLGGVAFRWSPDSTSETALRALAWSSPRTLPQGLSLLPSRGGWWWGGAAGGGGGIYLCYQPSTGSELGGPERRAGPSGTAKLAEGGAGRAGGRAGKRRGAGALLGAGAVARLAPARLSAGSRFFRERLPWVTRLRGDTALPSPSGNLSIREIDNPQRRAAHPLRSPSSGASRPKVAPLAQGREGWAGDVGSFSPLWTWPPAAGGGWGGKGTV